MGETFIPQVDQLEKKVAPTAVARVPSADVGDELSQIRQQVTEKIIVEYEGPGEDVPQTKTNEGAIDEVAGKTSQVREGVSVPKKLSGIAKLVEEAKEAFLSGDTKTMRTAFAKLNQGISIGVAPKDPACIFWCARLLHALQGTSGRANAVRAYQTILREHHQFAPAHDALAEIYGEMGKKKLADGHRKLAGHYGQQGLQVRSEGRTGRTADGKTPLQSGALPGAPIADPGSLKNADPSTEVSPPGLTSVQREQLKTVNSSLKRVKATEPQADPLQVWEVCMDLLSDKKITESVARFPAVKRIILVACPVLERRGWPAATIDLVADLWKEGRMNEENRDLLDEAMAELCRQGRKVVTDFGALSRIQEVEEALRIPVTRGAGAADTQNLSGTTGWGTTRTQPSERMLKGQEAIDHVLLALDTGVARARNATAEGVIDTEVVTDHSSPTVDFVVDAKGEARRANDHRLSGREESLAIGEDQPQKRLEDLSERPITPPDEAGEPIPLIVEEAVQALAGARLARQGGEAVTGSMQPVQVFEDGKWKTQYMPVDAEVPQAIPVTDSADAGGKVKREEMNAGKSPRVVQNETVAQRRPTVLAPEGQHEVWREGPEGALSNATTRILDASGKIRKHREERELIPANVAAGVAHDFRVLAAAYGDEDLKRPEMQFRSNRIAGEIERGGIAPARHNEWSLGDLQRAADEGPEYCAAVGVSFAAVNHNLARMYFKMGEFDRALQYSNQAVLHAKEREEGLSKMNAKREQILQEIAESYTSARRDPSEEGSASANISRSKQVMDDLFSRIVTVQQTGADPSADLVTRVVTASRQHANFLEAIGGDRKTMERIRRDADKWDAWSKKKQLAPKGDRPAVVTQESLSTFPVTAEPRYDSPGQVDAETVDLAAPLMPVKRGRVKTASPAANGDEVVNLTEPFKGNDQVETNGVHAEEAPTPRKSRLGRAWAWVTGRK